MSALSRVLIEDGKKSMDLTINIMKIFFFISNFSEFAPILTQNKIGDTTLKIISRELERYQFWKEEINQLKIETGIMHMEKDKNKNQYQNQTKVMPKQPGNPRLLLEEKLGKTRVVLKKQDELLFACFHLLYNIGKETDIEVKMVRRNILLDIMSSLFLQVDRAKLFDMGGDQALMATEVGQNGCPPSAQLLMLNLLFLKKLSIYK